MKPRKVSEIIQIHDEMVQTSLFNLSQMERTASGLYHHDTSDPNFKGYVNTLPMAFGGSVKNPEACAALVATLTTMVRGQICDGCGSTAGEDHFKLCAQCKVKYYCGTDCQVKDWKVHKERCRSAWKAGDLFRVHGLINRPELNSTVLELVHDDPTENGRWRFAPIGSGSVVALKEANVTRLMLKEDRGDAF